MRISKILSFSRCPMSHPRFTLCCGYGDLITSCLQHALSLRSSFFLPCSHIFAENTSALKASVEALSDAKYKKIHSFRKRGPRGSARFKRAGGARRDTLSSRLAPQASVVKGRDKVLQMKSPLESLHRFSTKETAKMSLIWSSFIDCVPSKRISFPRSYCLIPSALSKLYKYYEYRKNSSWYMFSRKYNLSWY